MSVCCTLSQTRQLAADPVATTIFLIRHAAHDHPPRMLCSRMPGVALSADGQAQALRLARHMAGVPLAAIHSSPSLRCRQTAAALALGTGVVPAAAADLDEIDYGDWTGRDWSELQGDPKWQEWNTCRDTAAPPNGEGMRSIQMRALRHLAEIRTRHGNATVAVVSHSDVIKSVLLHWLGVPLQGYARFDIDPASISAVALWADGGKVLMLNAKPA
jgi:broad specificity phosphatase PhoE